MKLAVSCIGTEGPWFIHSLMGTPIFQCYRCQAGNIRLFGVDLLQKNANEAIWQCKNGHINFVYASKANGLWYPVNIIDANDI